MLKNYMHYKCLCGSGKKFKSCCGNNKRKLMCVNFLLTMLEDFNKQAKSVADEYWHSNREGVNKLLSPAFDLIQNKENPTAIVLGAGNCMDIPLRQIVEQFSRVELVDADYKAIQKAKASLPESLQKKVTCTWLDITGLYYTIVPDIFDHILNARLPEAFSLLDTSIRNPRYIRPPITKKFDLSISINVVTQLIGWNFDFMVDLYKEKFKGDFNLLNAQFSELISNRAKDLSNTVVTLQHMKLLHAITASDGLVAISSDKFQWGSDAKAKSPVTDIVDHPEKMLDPEIQQRLLRLGLHIVGSNIDKHVDDLFTIVNRTQWLWHFTDEKTYLVDGYLLTPKMNNPI